jgi:predicted nuclease with TOPRIM domain
MDKDHDILSRVDELVAEERTLREKLQHKDIDETEEHQRLKAVEVQLDQCWDLLRQRRALRESGQNPDDASVRPAGTVEGYLN